jgi:hypothetical protein
MTSASGADRFAEGVLTAFFGSFLGAALGKDLAGITVNLISTGFEGLGMKAIDHLKSKGNYDLQKLVADAFVRSVDQALRRRNNRGRTLYWRDSQKKALADLKAELTKQLISNPTDQAAALLTAVLVGRQLDVRQSVAALIEPFLEERLPEWKGQHPQQWEELCSHISQQFFLEFQQLYKSDAHSRGRLALERDIAWATLQALQDQGLAITSAIGAQASALQEITSKLNRIATGLDTPPDWAPSFENIIGAIRQAEFRGKAHISQTASDLKHHITTELARRQLIERADHNLNRGDELNGQDYEKALAAYQLAEDCAKRGGDIELEAKAILRRIQLEINESVSLGGPTPFPFDKWDKLLLYVSSLGVLPDERLLMETRVAWLKGDIPLASTKLNQGRALSTGTPDTEFARLSLEILARRAQTGEVVTPEQIAVEEERIHLHLKDECAENAVLLLISLIGVKASLNIPIEDNLSSLEDAVAKSVKSPTRSSWTVHSMGRLAHQLTQHALGERVARQALTMAQHSGDAVDRARIGDILARHLRRSSSTDILEQLVRLRQQLSDDLVGSLGPVEALRDDALNLYVHHFSLSVLDGYNLCVTAASTSGVSVAEWCELLAKARSAECLLKNRMTDLSGDVKRLRHDIAHVTAEIHATLGQYRESGVAFQSSVSIGAESPSVSANRLFSLACDSAYFFCASGDAETAYGMHRTAAAMPVPEDRKNAKLESLRHVINDTKEAQAWLRSDNAQVLREVGATLGIRAAIRPTIEHMFDLWDDLPPSAQSTAGALYDYWGRGSFLRVCVAIQACGDDAITVDATTLDEVEMAARVLCPMFETVVVKWKGELALAGKGLTVTQVRKDRKQEWLYGSGLVHTGLDADHFGVLGYTNELPAVVIEWMRTEARPLVLRGRLCVVPAQLIGCAQQFVGASDALFASNLLGGAFLGAGGGVPVAPGESPAGLLNMANLALPFFAGVSMRDLASVLDEVGSELQPFRQRIFSMLADNSFAPGPREPLRRKAFKLELDEALAELDRLLRRVRMSTTLAVETSTANHMAVERGAHLAGTRITEWLTAISAEGRGEVKQWMPFLRLQALGGKLCWSQPPMRSPVIERVTSINQSWLAPPTIGAGAAISWKME